MFLSSQPTDFNRIFEFYLFNVKPTASIFNKVCFSFDKQIIPDTDLINATKPKPLLLKNY